MVTSDHGNGDHDQLTSHNRGHDYGYLKNLLYIFFLYGENVEHSQTESLNCLNQKFKFGITYN